jgi:hypothetical protein
MIGKEDLEKVRRVFDDGFRRQIHLLIGFAIAQFPTTMLMWTNRIAEPVRQA